ncbi:tetratricopeptide repeat protein [Streptomyces sp. NPDC049040]|uniref:tetratricopeptide repeat protein n=1 Tax=Streptomyces sp. NPDC049040 TaxID=3365593 RepID=UPI00372094AC
MDAADLDYRTRTGSGCIPSYVVSRLLELGHAEEVAHQAGHGEWYCAREQARLLGERDRQAEALEVLAPYLATGWWKAAEASAELLERFGRVEEAIGLVRPHAEAADRSALGFLAGLLARHGRGDEAFALLSPHIGDWFLAAALVDVAEGAGRDEDAAALLTARVEAGHRCGSPSCRGHGVAPDNAVDLLAAIRERQGRIDEAIDLLDTRVTTSVNGRDQLADLLARHGRIEELRDYAAAEYHGHAAERLAELLEEQGDVDGAMAVYRQPGDSPARRRRGPLRLAELLARHGRGDEAIALTRALADSPDGAEDWLVETLCTLYADQGRARDGLAFLDARAVRDGEEDWDAFMRRLPLMVACGEREQAIERALAHPESGTWYAAEPIAGLLAEAGRTGEAVAYLERHAPDSSALAWHLIGLGRVEEAVAILQARPGQA